ncbi:MAG: glycosyltransferase family 2 protein, partial [Firmicutes bacterium]|nr:glycosyltransferase family 2 protein [Candidatus Caballimonas caccae]
MPPKVSIILPVYGVEKYIIACLQSINNQKYRDFELLVIDDGCKDGSIKLCEEFLSKHPELNAKIIHKENGGLSSARNVGIKNSTGDYICFVDSDDTIRPNYIETLLNGFNDNDIEISTASFQLIKNGDTLINNINEHYTVFNREEILHSFLYRTIKLAPWCVMYKKTFIKSNHFYFEDKVKFSEDQVFFWHAFDKAKKVSYTTQIIYN